jgi:oligoribonuclease
MHTKNGLIEEINRTILTKPFESIEQDVTQWLEFGRVSSRKFVMAGSGVGHFDRRFIRQYMPEFDKLFEYWVIDVGVLRRCQQMWVGESLTDPPEKAHRALEDARQHLAEARVFREFWLSAAYNSRSDPNP